MRRQNEPQHGQVLVQVAMMMVVLLGFLALAVDVGQVYLKRRQLQNAADAGALEGARQICFEGQDWAAARGPATTVAHTNAPQGTVSFPAPQSVWHMTVVVTQTIPSFVASVVGQDLFNPGARATAVCGSADRGVGGIWPVSMNQADYDTIACDTAFTVWRGDNNTIDCTTCDCNRVIAAGNNLTQLCVPNPSVLQQLTTIGAPLTLGPGQTGWLNLMDPAPPLPLPTCNYENCGNVGVACYVEEPHPGPISVCDSIGNKSGNIQFSDGIKDGVCGHAGAIPPTRLNFPLWSDDWQALCPALNPVVGNCGTNSPYPVVGFGCIEVLGYSTKAYAPYLNGTPGECSGDLVVIFARKLCSGCSSFQGGTGGNPPFQGVRAVSLIE